MDDPSAVLDGGADDYLARPFAARELVARVRAILRRASW
jgi:two-component system OmpR family response regulator